MRNNEYFFLALLCLLFGFIFLFIGMAAPERHSNRVLACSMIALLLGLLNVLAYVFTFQDLSW